MGVLGIEFVPLSEPLRNRFLTLAAGVAFAVVALGVPAAITLAIWSVFTHYWWLTALYLYFCYAERSICQTGGRPSHWVRSWRLWQHFASYFPLRAHRAGTSAFDPRKNYFLISYPHGLFPMGIVTATGTTATNWLQLFPHHKARCATLSVQYYVPFYRELVLGLGGIACDAPAIAHVLNKPEGGYFVALMPGGAEEAFYCNPGDHKIVLKKRKGFVKLALKTGASLVPVYTFGEANMFRQSHNKYWRMVLERIKRITGIALIIPIGRGLFQYSFGLIPRQTPLDVVVGDPIEVKKSENPTVEEIDELHQKYIDALVKLFEQEKHKYVENPENTKLELVQ